MSRFHQEPYSSQDAAPPPRSLSGLFDEAFDLYKRHFKTIALLVALLYFPAQIGFYAVSTLLLKPMEVQFADSGMPDNPVNALLFFIGVLLIGKPEYGFPGLLFLAVWILSGAPLCLALDALLHGRSVSFIGIYRSALPILPRLLTAWSIALLAFIALSVVIGFLTLMLVGLLAIALSNTLGPTFAGILFIAGMVFNYLLCVGVLARFFLFTTQLVVLEGTPISGIVERNLQLVARPRFRRALAAAVALPLLVLGMQFIVLRSFYTTLDAFTLSPLVRLLLSTLVSSGIVFFLQPYPILLLSLLYYDHRVRREALDILMLADQIVPSSQAEEALDTRLMTSPSAAFSEVIPSPRGQG